MVGYSTEAAAAGRRDRDETEFAPSTSSTEPGRTPLTKGDLFRLLRSQRRRHTLRHLSDAGDGGVSASDLAGEVAAAECDTSVDDLSPEDRQRVYLTLYHSHLPRLDRAGVIEYDQVRGQITPNPSIHEFDPYL